MRNTITEARNDHKAMIDAVLAAVNENTAGRIGHPASISISEEYKNKIQSKWDETVQKIKPILKKEDRIMWYLRFFRQHLISQYRDKDIFDPIKIQKIISDYERKVGFSYDKEAIGAPSIVHHLEHFLSLPIREIQNYQFKNQPAYVILDEFDEFEQEWKKTVSSMFVDNDSEILIDFKDGWCWVNTKKAYCSKEAAAMGHCGNSPRSETLDTLLSLRKGKVINGDRYWEPHLTFILNDNGQLTEMKGKGNDKPAERYHPMIIKLLLHPIVHGIVGGGYLPENNFSISDLGDDQAMKLIEQKPELANASLMYELNGYKVNDEISEKVIDELEAIDNRHLTNYLSVEKTSDANGDDLYYMIVARFDYINDIAKAIGNSDLEQMADIIDDYFTSIADWLDEKDAEKALTLFIEESSDDDLELVDLLTNRLRSKLGVDEDHILPSLFHVFPKSVESIYKSWKKDMIAKAAIEARDYVENINWSIPEIELRHDTNDDSYYLRIPVSSLIDMLTDYHSRESGYSDGYLETAISEGWASYSPYDNEDIDINITVFYQQQVEELIKKILELFETEDQLTFDFEPQQLKLDI